MSAELLTPLSPRQRELLAAWLPGALVQADLSWGLVGTTVLDVLAADGTRCIVKAGGPKDHHLEREIHAHLHWLSPWTATGHAPQLLHRDREAKLLVTRYLPGVLVQGHPAEDRADTYAQAGALLASFHGQHRSVDPGHEDAQNRRTLAWLAGEHRIPDAETARLQKLIASWPTPPATLVPTHGDWQPRNWLIDDGTVRVIDFGRAALREPMTDLARLAARQFRDRPDLEAAFFSGYGPDPREVHAWRRVQLREAVGTAVWAYQVGDEQFEAQGFRMLAEALAVF
ncbi:phosphotransferase [Ruania albidiflava]|uniref:phosphotransferase n=1 Tax=Ruania albidiflava TaxID=366586 RepID=UPI0003B79D95|nr:phosphotransferase [Ruania albidiflava]